jgi:DNA-binding transcriptional MerR regulator
MYTPAQVAQLLHISPSRLRDLALEGKVPASAKTPGGHRRYTEQDISDARYYLRNQAPAPARTDDTSYVILKKFTHVPTSSYAAIWNSISTEYSEDELSRLQDKLRAQFTRIQDHIAKQQGELDNRKKQVSTLLMDQARVSAFYLTLFAFTIAYAICLCMLIISPLNESSELLQLLVGLGLAALFTFTGYKAYPEAVVWWRENTVPAEKDPEYLFVLEKCIQQRLDTLLGSIYDNRPSEDEIQALREDSYLLEVVRDLKTTQAEELLYQRILATALAT